MKRETIFVIIFVLLIIMLYAILLWAVYSCLNGVIYARDRKKMFVSLGNVLSSHNNNTDTTNCFKEIKLIFKHQIDVNNALKRNYNNIGELLEKYLVILNSGEINTINLDIENKDLLKKYILDLIDEFERKNPMEQINGANNILLHKLIECEKNGKKDEFIVIVNQLANEIKTMQDNIFEREKKSKKQDMISITGIILSIVFGVMTFIQFFV